MVIQGDADALVYLNYGNCRWDSCAGEAIVKAMGGIFTNQLGEDIDYDPSKADYQNKEGNIGTFDSEMHKQIIEAYNKLKK